MQNNTNYGNDLDINIADIKRVCTSGDNSYEVECLSKKPYIKMQTARFDKNNLAKELKEYGTWTDDELTDHEQNIQRWLWISAWDCYEELTM